jgi:hypothetical protein
MAQLKFEMRQLYSHIGFAGTLQVLMEMLVGARLLAEVMAEERSKKEPDNG